MAPPKIPSASAAKREIRILMLHGFTQSGTIFHAKTAGLAKILTKALLPLNIHPTFLYATAPIRLSARDRAAFFPTTSSSHHNNNNDAAEDGIDAYSWYSQDELIGGKVEVERSMNEIARYIREEGAGRIDGVIGFSQGAAMAGIVTAVLEGLVDDDGGGDERRTRMRSPPVSDERKQGTHDENENEKRPESRTEAEDRQLQSSHMAWMTALREANGGSPLKFAVIYSGFVARLPSLVSWLYEPPIRTPTLHFMGSLDAVVEQSRSQALVDRCVDPMVVEHPGAHFVPISKAWANVAVGFIMKHC